jgi:hypothetical protein
MIHLQADNDVADTLRYVHDKNSVGSCTMQGNLSELEENCYCRQFKTVLTLKFSVIQKRTNQLMLLNVCNTNSMLLSPQDKLH